MRKTIPFQIAFVLALLLLFFLESSQGGEPIKPLWTWREQGYFAQLAFHPKGKILATGGHRDRLVKIWQFPEGKKLATLDAHNDWIGALTFSPDGKMLASVSWDAVFVWEVGAWKNLYAYKGEVPGRSFSDVKSIGFSADNKSLYIAHSLSVKRWKLGEKKVDQIVSTTGPVSSFCLLELPEHKLLGADLKQTIMGLRVDLWALPSAKLKKTLKSDDLNVHCLAISPDGKTLAGGSIAETVHIWDLTSGKHIGNFNQPGQVTSLVFSPDSRSLALSYKPDRTKSKPGAFLLMDVASGKEIVRLAKAHENGVACLAFSSDGRYLLTGARTLKIWDLAKK